MDPAIIILIIAAWIVFATLPAYVAMENGRDGTAWFVVGIVFGPVLALLALIALPALEQVAPAAPQKRPAELSADELRRRLLAEREGRPPRGGTLRRRTDA